MPRRTLDHPLVPAVLGVLLEGPAHPYQILTALRERGENHASALNRGTLYHLVDALAGAGWVRARDRERAGNRPERTVYVLTPEGTSELIRRLDALVRTPEREFSAFLGAVAHLGALGPQGASDALGERLRRLRERTAGDEQALATTLAQGTPRLFVIEAEYALELARAEAAWIEAVLADIRDGTLPWPTRPEPAAPAPTLLFGVYAGSVAGDDRGGLASGPPDDPARIHEALDLLQGRPDRPFLVRAYTGFTDGTRPGGPHPTATPADAERYAVRGRRLDLVAQYGSARGDVDGYRDFVRDLVDQYGAVTATLQIAEEPNVTDVPTLDGHYPRVQEAIVAGTLAAAERARELGLTGLRLGFNTTPLFGPGASFVSELTQRGGPDFVAALDYVGLDFFPDVFRPVAPAELAAAVEGLLRHHRTGVLAPAGLGALPLHLTEHGWPTGAERTPRRQAEVVGTVVGVTAALAAELGLSGYTHFALRDADSARPGLFHRFGLLTDDYAPKPAFATLRGLVEEYGG